MRKFVRVTIIILLFFSCLFVGVYLAEFADKEKPLSLASPDLETSNQINILVNLVDQFEAGKTEFISSWSVILYYPDPSGMVIVPLSATSEADFNEISRNFRLDSHNALNIKTIDYFEKKFNAKWDAVVVMDINSVQLFSKWMTNNEYQFDGKDLRILSEVAENTNKPGEEFCNFVKKQTLPPLELLDANAFSEDHFQSQLSQETLKSIWTKLMSDDLPKCEVIYLHNEN